MGCTRYNTSLYMLRIEWLIYKQIIQYDPIGVCAGIGAWNGSLAFIAYKSAAALAVGCTFIYKGSEKSPIGVLQMGELVKKAGFPPGMFTFPSRGCDMLTR
jgi:acyl-CoA reductase-like NAD-dependent aldehyde dehydrogenase